MTHKRNTKGLVRAAKERRETTIKRVESAIKLLVKEKKVINFNTVSKIARVGKPWLYKENVIRKQIEELREKTRFTVYPVQATSSSSRISEKSKETITQMLRDRVRKLEEENKQLRGQIETLYGELYGKKMIHGH